MAPISSRFCSVYDAALPILTKLLKGCTDVQQLKGYGRRHTGYFAKLPSGTLVYFVVRRHSQMYRDGLTSQTEAMQTEKASWMIDKPVLREITKRGVQYVLIFCKDTGDLFVSPLESWLDKTKARDQLTKGFGADEVRHLGLHHMTQKTLSSHLTITRV